MGPSYSYSYSVLYISTLAQDLKSPVQPPSLASYIHEVLVVLSVRRISIFAKSITCGVGFQCTPKPDPPPSSTVRFTGIMKYRYDWSSGKPSFQVTTDSFAASGPCPNTTSDEWKVNSFIWSKGWLPAAGRMATYQTVLKVL